MPHWYTTYAVIFLFGAIIGSFLNVVILRHEKGEGVDGRSYCPSCHKTLRWYELIPVFSYLLQRGRCRECHAGISVQYPAVELMTGFLFVMIAASIGTSPALYMLHAGIWSLLMVIAVYDLRTTLIPDRFSYSFATLALVSQLMTWPVSYTALLAGPILFLPFYALWRYSEGKWMGLGDGKLSLGIGWYLGLADGVSAIMLAFWIGAACSLLLIGIQRIYGHIRKDTSPSPDILSLKSEVPFGPFLVVGTLMVWVWHIDILALAGM